MMWLSHLSLAKKKKKALLASLVSKCEDTAVSHTFQRFKIVGFEIMNRLDAG